MACYYVYTDGRVDEDIIRSAIGPNATVKNGIFENRVAGNVIVYGRTIEDVRNALMVRAGRLENTSFNELFGNGAYFKYFHAETMEEVKLAIEQAHKNADKVVGEKVTSIAELVFPDHKEVTGNSLSDQVVDLTSKFRKLFGELIHKLFEVDVDLWQKKVVPELQKLFKLYSGKLTEEMLTSSFDPNSTNIIKFINKYKNATPETILPILTCMKNIKEEVIKRYGGASAAFYPEWDVVSLLEKRAYPLKGRMDLIVVTPDKKVIIVDFKTTSKSGPTSQASKDFHWMLLALYRDILSDYGINTNDITFENVIIEYNLSDETPISLKAYENPDTGISGTLRTAYLKLKAKFFPTQIDLGESAKVRQDRVEQKIAKLCANLMLRKYDKDVLKDRTLHFCDNELTNFCALVADNTGRGKIVKFNWGNKEKTIVELHDPQNGSLIKSMNIDDFVDLESRALTRDQEFSFNAIRELILSNNIEGIRLFILYDERKGTALWANLYPYLNGDYEYVSIPELELRFNIICMKNSVNGAYNFIKISTNAGNLEYSRDPNRNILFSVITDPTKLNKFQESKDVLRPSIGNLNILLAALVISEFADKIADLKIGQIECISLASGEHKSSVVTMDLLDLTFRLLQHIVNEDPTIENAELFKDVYDKWSTIPRADVTEVISSHIVSACRHCAVDTDVAVLRLAEWDSIEGLNDRINALLKVIDELENDANLIGQWSSNTNTKERIANGLDYCKKLIQYLLNVLAKKSGPTEMYDMNSYGISLKESIIAGYNLLARGTILEFTKTGLLITGLCLALESSVSYANPSQLIGRFNQFYDTATALIIKLVLAEAVELNNATEKFIAWGKKNGLISIGDPIHGNHEKLYASLMQKNSSGQIDQFMRFINPYSKNGLADLQNEYLEIVLWSINRHRMPNNIVSVSHKHMSYVEFRKTEAFSKYKNAINESGKWLNIPLHRRDGSNGTWSGFKAVIQQKKSISSFIQGEILRMRLFMEPEVLNELQEKEREKKILKLEYYNWYKDNEKNRVELTEKYQPSDWDFNINRLVIDYVLADVRDLYFNDLLKIADRYLAETKILELTTGRDFSKQTEALLNRIKVSIYGKSLYDAEWADVMAGVGIVKQLQSIAKISVRPMLFLKEMILGRIRNTSNILAGTILNDNKITMTHLREAAEIVFGPEFFGKAFHKLVGDIGWGSKTMADALNDIYTINDRDMSVVGEKLSYDSYGLYNWGSRMLYLNTISPDWFNRMIIFIAKMKADGTWEANKLEDNKLVYRPEKDERIKEFWNNKEHPKDTAEYKKAEEFYKLRMLLFVTEGFKNPDGSDLFYGQIDPVTNLVRYDPFPRCYTVQEERSIKELIGMIYGYYSHQERASMLKGMWWGLYTQFLTFMPGEIRKYLAIGTDSSIVTTVLEKDLDGNLLYWEEQEDKFAPGNTLRVKTTSEFDSKHHRNAPVLVDKKSAYEGLAISMAKTVGQICRGDFKSIKDNPQQLKNTELFLFNTLFAALVAAIVAYLSGLGAKTQTVAISADLLQKTGNELDFYHTVLQPVGDFGIVGTNFVKGTFTNAFKTISSDNYSLFDLSEDTFSVIKDAHLNLNV